MREHLSEEQNVFLRGHSLFSDLKSKDQRPLRGLGISLYDFMKFQKLARTKANSTKFLRPLLSKFEVIGIQFAEEIWAAPLKAAASGAAAITSERACDGASGVRT